MVLTWGGVVVVVDVVIVDTKKDLNVYKEGIITAAADAGTDAAEEERKSCCKPAPPPKACCGAAPPVVAGIADCDLNEFAGVFYLSVNSVV